MKKIINYLDKHRLILVLLILIIISLCFIIIKSVIFLNHKFLSLECTSSIDETYCYHHKIKIYKNPENEKENIFNEKKDEIESLKEKYQLPNFNFYTSYYYEVVSLLNYNETEDNKDLLDFFTIYNASYNISEFYKKNILYYDLFYRFKINLN